MTGRSFTREAPGVRPVEPFGNPEEFEQTFELDARPVVAVIGGVVYRNEAVPDARATWQEVYGSRLVKGKVRKAW